MRYRGVIALRRLGPGRPLRHLLVGRPPGRQIPVSAASLGLKGKKYGQLAIGRCFTIRFASLLPVRGAERRPVTGGSNCLTQTPGRKTAEQQYRLYGAVRAVELSRLDTVPQ